METLHLSKLEPALAAQLLAGCAHLDPAGLVSERDIPAIAARGACFAATAEGSQAVYVVHVANGVAWIDAAKGFGPADWSGILLPVIEQQARGVARVAFQTSRRGLVRRALQHGYDVRGWILGKDMK
jgi:hypothetical protein